MKLVVAALSTLFLAAFCAYLSGLRVNTTHSLPVGFYLDIDAPIERGSIVLACPPAGLATSAAQERGYIGSSIGCPDNTQRLIKRVVGETGDLVSPTEDGLTINGQLIPNSKLIQADSEGRSLPVFFTRPTVLSPGQVLLMGDTAISFDSRYFGPVERYQIRAVLRPLWTW